MDGSIANCFTDDTSAKMRAVGFHVIDVEDGTNDVCSTNNSLPQCAFPSDYIPLQLAAVISALSTAKTITGKPTFVHIRTIIGFGSRKANTGPAHGVALGDEEVAYVKQLFGFNPTERLTISSQVYGTRSSTVFTICYPIFLSIPIYRSSTK